MVCVRHCGAWLKDRRRSRVNTYAVQPSPSSVSCSPVAMTLSPERENLLFTTTAMCGVNQKMPISTMVRFA